MENGLNLYEKIQEVGRVNEKIKQDAYFSLKSEEEWLDKRFTELALKHIPSQMDENERKTSAKRSFDKMEAKAPGIDPKSMKVVDLRAALRDRGLCTKGLKAQLIQRLTKALNDSTDTVMMMDTEEVSCISETPKLDPSSLRVVDLRKELSVRGLSTKGLKAVLIKRLQQALDNEETSMEVDESEEKKTILESIDESRTVDESMDSPHKSPDEIVPHESPDERVNSSPVPHKSPDERINSPPDERVNSSPPDERINSPPDERVNSSSSDEIINLSSPDERVKSSERMSLSASVQELDVPMESRESVVDVMDQTLCLEDDEADRLKEEAEQEAMAHEENIQRELAEKRRISEQLRRKRILEEAERLRQERQTQIERANERAELETMRMEEELERKFAAGEKRRLEKEQELFREKQQKIQRQKQIEDEARKFRENVRNTIKQKTITSESMSSSGKVPKTAPRSGKPSNLVSGLHSFTTLVEKPTGTKVVKKDPPRPIAALRMAEKNRLAEEKKAQQKKLRMQQRRDEIKRMEEKKKAALQLQRQQVFKQNKVPAIDKPRPKPMKDPSTQLQELRAADEKRRQEIKKPVVKPTPNQVMEQHPPSKGLSISDRSDSDSDRSEKNRERDIPTWAQRENLKKALSIQFSRENAIDPVPSIFPEFPPTCDLEAYFETNARKSRFTRRSSSSAWQHDRATEKDRENYRRDMGFVE